MNVTHTPGPWAVKAEEFIDGADGSPVARVYSRQTRAAEDLKANADLIAAAPEMLEALYYILNIEGACFGADESWNLDWHWSKVRAAIAKAEGRA